MTTFLAYSSGAALNKDAAVKELIQRLQHFVAQNPILSLKQLFPAPLEFFPVVIHQPVEHAGFRAAPAALQALPIGIPAIRFHPRMNRGKSAKVASIA